MNCLQTFGDPGYGPLLGIDHTTTFKCKICKKTRMPIRKSSRNWRIFQHTHVIQIDEIVSRSADVCYFCLRENARWLDGLPCGDCIEMGYFTDSPVRFIGCGCGFVEGCRHYPDPNNLTIFKTFVIKKMNGFTVVERLVLLWLAKQKDWIFSRLPKDLFKHMCKVGLPLPCPE